MKNYIYFLIGLFLISCNSDELGLNDDWDIPINQVLSGGPGKDGIPSLDDAEYLPVDEIEYIEDTDLVIGYVHNGVAKAYPHLILDWHEIINDEIEGKPVAITYCPLTGTGIGWDRTINGNITTFGVSGLLYNSNLIPYDRNTNSNWSQMLNKSVSGNLRGQAIETFQLVETTWSTWKAMYPNSLVLSDNTGFSRNYNNYPYGNYRTDNNTLFPVENENDALSKKSRVHGIIINENSARVYELSIFDTLNIIYENVGGDNIMVVGESNRNFINSFHNPDNLVFNYTNDGSANILTDNEGNTWDIFGNAVAGPRTGEQLTPTNSYMGYWFAWAAFYPNITLFE